MLMFTEENVKYSVGPSISTVYRCRVPISRFLMVGICNVLAPEMIPSQRCPTWLVPGVRVWCLGSRDLKLGQNVSPDLQNKGNCEWYEQS